MFNGSPHEGGGQIVKWRKQNAVQRKNENDGQGKKERPKGEISPLFEKCPFCSGFGRRPKPAWEGVSTNVWRKDKTRSSVCIQCLGSGLIEAKEKEKHEEE